jgi:DNA replication protein DnaC
MLINPTIAKLQALGLGAMAVALADQLATPGPWGELSFEDRLGLLVDREADARDSRRLATRLKAAKLRYPAAVEDIDFRSPRGLNRAAVLDLAGAGWVSRHHNLVVTGPTGVGKSFLACALANAALRQGHTALYVRTPRLLDDLALGRADGRYARVLNSLGRVSLLLLDDFLLTPAPVEACRDLLEVIEDRAQRRSTLVASQLRWRSGTRPWPIPPWPRPSWTASCRPPTASRSRAPPCASASPRPTRDVKPAPQSLISARKRPAPIQGCGRREPQNPSGRPMPPGQRDAPIVCHEEVTIEPRPT